MKDNDDAVIQSLQMLEFLLNQFEMHSPQMNGQHSWRFHNSGWPWIHAKGPSIVEAVRAAMAEVERSKREAEE